MGERETFESKSSEIRGETEGLTSLSLHSSIEKWLNEAGMISWGKFQWRDSKRQRARTLREE